MFVEAFKKILDSEAPKEFVRNVELGHDANAVWQSFEKSGFLDLMRDEDAGGAALPLLDLYEICCLLGASSTCLPLADTLIARLLIPREECTDGMIVISSDCVATNNKLQCTRVPFGKVADYVLTENNNKLILLDTKKARHIDLMEWRSQSSTLLWLQEPHSFKQFTANHLHASAPHALKAYGAALYAAMLCGAMQKTFELTLEYCNDREQFGRSLGKFQVVQHQLAVMSEHIVASCLATQAAFATTSRALSIDAAAVAKARASEAALLVANTAHALHGAIGISDECDLNLYTRRLHEWRLSHGSENYWHQWLGRQALTQEKTFCEFVQSF